MSGLPLTHTDTSRSVRLLRTSITTSWGTVKFEFYFSKLLVYRYTHEYLHMILDELYNINDNPADRSYSRAHWRASSSIVF